MIHSWKNSENTAYNTPDPLSSALGLRYAQYLAKERQKYYTANLK